MFPSPSLQNEGRIGQRARVEEMPFSNRSLLALFLALALPLVVKAQGVHISAVSPAQAQGDPYISVLSAALSDTSVGSSLNTSSASSWLSDSGRFAFGFYPEGNGFRVGVHLIISPSKTAVVWTARPDLKPFSKDAFLHFTKKAFVVTLTKGVPDIVLIDFSSPASSAAMLNNGNFVVYSDKAPMASRNNVLFDFSVRCSRSGASYYNCRNNPSANPYSRSCSSTMRCRSSSSSNFTIIWRSFDYPTDTILGSQVLPCGIKLISSAGDSNNAAGFHVLQLQCDGSLVSYLVNSNTTTWSFGHYGANFTALVLDEDGQLYVSNVGVYKKAVSRYNPRNQTEMLYRARLDPEGIFRLYALNLDTNSSYVVEEIPYYQDKCQAKDVCGANSYCILVQNKPNCSCIPGFDYIDHGAPSAGCQRSRAMQSCSAVMMEEVKNMVGVDQLAYSVISAVSRDECSSSCLNDCDCYAALYRDQQCSNLKLPLTSGWIDSNDPSVALIKLAGISNNSVILPNIEIRVVAIVRCSIVTLVICVVVIAATRWACWEPFWQYREKWHKWELAFTEEIAPRYFSYEELVRGTEETRQRLGEGGQGTVFRVSLPIGDKIVDVAVKRLHGVDGDGERDFQAEMRLIGRAHHVNLVRLLGFCHDRISRLLVYEFMCKGSLADHIFERPPLRPDWEMRKRLLLGAARGIYYLHQECDTKIIHRDIKPENILISLDWTAKISDFGLAKLLMENQTRTSTRTMAAGTNGYVAPECLREDDGRGGIQVTEKVDVYSFGVVILETLCCLRNRDSNLCAMVRHHYFAGDIGKVLDGEEVEALELERVVKLGILCVQDDPEARPFMEDVVMVLEGVKDVPNPPLLT